MPVPVLKTERLVLRPYRVGDQEAVHAYASDPEVVRYMNWGPNTLEETAAYIRLQIRMQNMTHPNSYLFAITRAEDDRLIGSCGLVVEDAQSRQGSIGYALTRKFWGRGYATEAARRLLQFGFEDLNMHRIIATCRVGNVGSRNVLEKIGMRQEGDFRNPDQVDGEPADSLLFAIPAEEWQELPAAGVLFDMDGVMVDTEPIYFRSNQEIFQQLGFNVTQAGYARFVGLSAEKMWESLKAEHDLPQPLSDLVKMEKEGMVRGLMDADLEPMPGLFALINRLEEEKVAFGLASSSSHEVIRIILSKLGLEDRFRSVTSGEDVANGKPAPDIFLLAASKLGLPPARCLVIEDSASGVRGAKAAGMACVGFRNPHSGNQDLSPADLIVDRFDADAIERILQVVSQP